jgi:hypothetical protein
MLFALDIRARVGLISNLPAEAEDGDTARCIRIMRNHLQLRQR